MLIIKSQELLDMSQAIGRKSYPTLKKEIKLISNQSLIIDVQININETQELINVSQAVRNNRYSLFSESKSLLR